MNTIFSSILTNITDVAQKDRGDYNELLKLTDVTDKAWGNNGYFAYQDRNTGEYKIGISRGGEKKEVAISKEAYMNLPNVEVNTQFLDEFGDRLALNNGTSTYAKGDASRKSAYIADQPDNSPFIVQYHLTAGRAPNTYNVRIWVDDTRTKDGKPVNKVDGELFTFYNATSAMPPSQVLEVIKGLSNPELIDQYLHSAGYIKE
jgi:hypothetical protein